MKKIMWCVVLGLASFATVVGCGQKTSTKSTETIKNPEGTTKIEHEDTVKKSNENAPNP